MKRFNRFLLSALVLPVTCLFAHVPATKQNSKTLSAVLHSDTPAIVKVIVERRLALKYKRSRKKRRTPYMSEGSGFIINAKQGIIVTNAHVVRNAKFIYIALTDQRRYLAQLIGKDDGFDIAILRIKARNLKQLRFADSDTVNVGDVVAAVGSPFGLDQTVTSGVVSAINVSRPKIEGFQSFIQTDAAINPGNSGGPLLNLNGQVVGINTAILGPGANIGIGFAIPSNMAASVIHQLLKYRNVKRGMLGVVTQNLTPDIRGALHIKTPHGALVSQVVPSSPAAKAGLRKEDVITEVNQHHIVDSHQLRNILGIMRPGTDLSMNIVRDGESELLKATVQDPKLLLLKKANPFLNGMMLKDYQVLKGDGKVSSGTIITRIQPTSPASLAGLLPGDVITEAHHQSVKNLEQLEQVINSNPSSLLLRIMRGKLFAYIVIRKPGT